MLIGPSEQVIDSSRLIGKTLACQRMGNKNERKTKQNIEGPFIPVISVVSVVWGILRYPF